MIWRLCVATAVLALSMTAKATDDPKMVNVNVEKTYSPIGFDDNDRVQVMVAGTFPSTCYKVGAAGALVDKATKTIRIWQTAYLYNETCLTLKVPFTQVVNIGVTEAGKYRIDDGLSGKTVGEIPIEVATRPGPDDYLYAPVEDAFLVVDASGKKGLTLLGAFEDRCTVLKEVKVSYYPEVIVVQPVAEHIDVRDCGEEKMRYVKTIELDPTLDGTYLLHVRSMNGQSVNKMVDTKYLE